ncbi:hypothetical protein [Mesorhizobium sp.]|uniref:hypothetical protein n=1 Tax=Mesorhizobium sp. TaxID=1871066 RepID=UPI000FE9845F|nr:hypothetical protein [Mesorhizobium sp.]RWE78781.1 MAG: hypothetical protein EOS42_04150 [Mesorhizobium sp.]
MKQSPFSSGVVKNREPIVYALIDPDQIQRGTIQAISKSRLKKSDLSVCRAQETTAQEAWKNIVVGQLENIPTRIDEGYAWARASEIRNLKLARPNIGAFCVIDDGLKHFGSHAVLGFSPAPQGFDSNTIANDREAARGNLLRLFQRRGVCKWTDWSFR